MQAICRTAHCVGGNSERNYPYGMRVPNVSKTELNAKRKFVSDVVNKKGPGPVSKLRNASGLFRYSLEPQERPPKHIDANIEPNIDTRSYHYLCVI